MESSTESSPRLIDRFMDRIESVPGSDKLLLRVAFFAIIGTGVWLILTINQQYTENTPTRGGSIVEGIIGTPRFINPALASTRADQDVTALIYNGLMKIASDGTLVNDVAESVNVSEDGLTYNITLNKNIEFHDGTPLTAKDVAFTIRLIQNPDLKSPLRGNWNDVVVEELGEYELNIVLDEAYAPFIENFTLGIMPSHAWSDLPIEQLPFSQLNTEPIGSGPFSLTSAKRDTSGLINHYTLSAFRRNDLNSKIDTLELVFFQNEEKLLSALRSKEVDSTAYVSPSRIKELTDDGFQLVEQALPRSFGIFLNQNHSVALRDKKVREALTTAINRDELIAKSLFGYGVPIAGPIAIAQPDIESEDDIEGTVTQVSREKEQEQAKEILRGAGWKLNEVGIWQKEIDKQPVTLSIVLRTSNSDLFVSLVDVIAEQWREIGVEVVVEQFEQTGLIQSVIRPRDFQALLFGLDMSRSYDLYPFWHSSQQDDPGLNIAQYANVNVDDLLETARIEQSESVRHETLIEAGEIIAEESPAIFLFQPTLTYVVSSDVTVVEVNNPGRPSDRFSNVSEWHTESDFLWPIFRDDAVQ